MNPFLAMEKQEVTTEETLPLLKAFGWEFEHDTFLYNNNGTITISNAVSGKTYTAYQILKREFVILNLFQNLKFSFFLI